MKIQWSKKITCEDHPKLILMIGILIQILFHRRKPALSYNAGKESKAVPYVRRPIDYTALDHIGHGGVKVAQKNSGGGGDGDSADSVSTTSARDIQFCACIVTS